MPKLDQLTEKAKVAEDLWMTTSRSDGKSATYRLWFVLDGQRLYILSPESSNEVLDVQHEAKVEVAIGDPNSSDQLGMQADVMVEESWVPMMLGLLEKKYGAAHSERMQRTSEAAKVGHVIIKLKPLE